MFLADTATIGDARIPSARSALTTKKPLGSTRLARFNLKENYYGSFYR